MNTTINNISDNASAALVAAGKISATVNDRYRIINESGEPVVCAIDEQGKLGVDESASKALRYSALVPTVIRENLKLERPEDVVNHVLRFRTPGTVIFARKPSHGNAGEAHAVIDYSKDRETPAWNRQHASAPIALSEDVKKWNGVFHTQMEFAALIDDFASDVVGDPSGDMLLEMAGNLEVTDIKVTGYKRDPKTRLYNVTLVGKTETTTVVYPKFTLLISVFEDQPPVHVEMRLELEKKGDTYGFRTRIHRFDKLVQAEFEKVCKDLAEKTGVPVWQGQAPDLMKCS